MYHLPKPGSELETVSAATSAYRLNEVAGPLREFRCALNYCADKRRAWGLH